MIHDVDESTMWHPTHAHGIRFIILIFVLAFSIFFCEKKSKRRKKKLQNSGFFFVDRDTAHATTTYALSFCLSFISLCGSFHVSLVKFLSLFICHFFRFASSLVLRLSLSKFLFLFICHFRSAGSLVLRLSLVKFLSLFICHFRFAKLSGTLSVFVALSLSLHLSFRSAGSLVIRLSLSKFLFLFICHFRSAGLSYSLLFG